MENLVSLYDLLDEHKIPGGFKGRITAEFVDPESYKKSLSNDNSASGIL